MEKRQIYFRIGKLKKMLLKILDRLNNLPPSKQPDKPPIVDHFCSDLDNVSKPSQHKNVVNWGIRQAAKRK